MSIASYSELKTAIGTWLHRSDLSTIAADLVTLAENRIYRDLRIRAMETALNSTISSGVVAVPAGYVELKHAYIDGTPVTRLTRKTAEWVYSKYSTRSADAKPLFIAREAENFIFGPYPDSGYTVKGIYYKRLTALSDSNTTNWFTANASDLLLWAALVEAEPYLINDNRVVLWEAKYQAAKARIQAEDDNEEVSGSPLSVTV